jgi:hypothetical protein
MPDWRNPDDYRFCEHLTAPQWAWEFLRRNPAYRQDWAWFSAVWAELEAEYGRPPHRDFFRWQQDPRAYVPDERCGEGEKGAAGVGCAGVGGRLLIECWMGAKWSFKKFPPDPADDDPVGAGRLEWTAPEPVAEPLRSGRVVPERPAWLALGFDLSRPLGPQLEEARRRLAVEQRRLRKAGALDRFSVAGNREDWTLCLRVIDAREAGADRRSIEEHLSVAPLEPVLDEAERLLRVGYRDIATLPERW